MRLICAWHKDNFGSDLVIKEDDGSGYEGDSHGICPECEKIEMRKLQEDMNSGYFEKGGKMPVTTVDRKNHRCRCGSNLQYPAVEKEKTITCRCGRRADKYPGLAVLKCLPKPKPRGWD